MDVALTEENHHSPMEGLPGTVFVVDDDLSLRQALESLIRSAGGCVETFSSAAEFLARPAFDGPSCIVLDVHLPGLSGLGLQEHLARIHGHTPIIFITGHGDVPTSVRAMKAGALDFLIKPFDEDALLEAIRRALLLNAESRTALASLQQLRLGYASLTERQREVMALVVDGLLNKQIAATLGITEVTVKIHRGRVMHRMGAASLADLVRMADRLAGRQGETKDGHNTER
jgi:FixJ family two-component response regulator